MIRYTFPVTLLALAGTAVAQWNEVTPASSPSGRIEPSMAYDSNNGVTVLFGGADVGGFPPSNFSDTWTWNGAAWTDVTPASGPSGRYFAGMSYDGLRQKVVLYGGLGATFFGRPNYFDDTWEYDTAANTWTQVITANTPGALIGNPGVGEHAMAYDATGNATVMFGGELFSGIVPVGTTLEYDGNDWTLISPAQSPAPRSQAAMCTASTLGGVLMFGGTNFNNPPGPNGEIHWNDTWVYSAQTDTWTQLTPANSPSPRAGAKLAWNPNLGVYVLHGGYVPDPVDPINNPQIPVAETWVFDGTDWTDISAAVGNPTAPRVRFEMAEGPNGCTVLFGGADAFFGPTYADTWSYGYCAVAYGFGAGCPGSNGTPALAAAVRPLLGTNYSLDVTNLDPAAQYAFVVTGFSNTNSVLGPLPFNLGSVGLGSSCFLLSSDDDTLLVGATAGAASYVLSIPADPVFNGTNLYHQAGSIDPAAVGGFAVSNGVATRIGSL